MINNYPVRAILLYVLLAASGQEVLAGPIPHSSESNAEGVGITNAWYGCATKRYAHGVLGDRIEGGCLVVKDNNGKEYKLDLPENQVFEDLVPRIKDVNNDGINDVVTIRSNTEQGAAIAIYSISNAKLTELATTPPIGRAYRWLAPAGIADFNGNGVAEIAYVQTPHIGGILKIWEMQEGKLVQLASYRGVSNHSIGSKRVSTSRVLDHNKDGSPDLALPDQSGSRIWVFSMHPDLKLIDDLPMDSDFFLPKQW